MGFAVAGMTVGVAVDVEAGLAKLLYHFVAYFEAVLADTWADGCDDTARLGSYGFHGCYSSGGYVLDGSFPSGVGGCNDRGLRVGEQDGDAIGCVDTDYHIGDGGDKGVDVVERADG